MSTSEAPRGVPSTQYFHALLRPAILQILRAQGYYACSPAVLDNVTELASRHLTELADRTARFMETNSEATLQPTLADARMAMEQCGVFAPTRLHTAQVWADQEDTGGVEDFIGWAEGPKNAKIRKVAQAISEPTGLEDADAAEEPANNYLAGKSPSSEPKDDLSVSLLTLPALFPIHSFEEEAQQERPGIKVHQYGPGQGQRPRRHSRRGRPCSQRQGLGADDARGRTTAARAYSRLPSSELRA